MASAYASGIFLSPPREVRPDYSMVAEITDSSSTIGLADSSLSFMSQADINKTLDQLQAIGVNNVRVLVPWALVEQSDNVYNWTQMDMVMSAAAARNMGVMADINSTPLWAAPPNTYPGAGTPPVAQFSTFVKDFATKYGSTVSAYEIWNEPNYALFYQPIDPVSYTALLAAAYPVIKSIDPTATVVAGALGAGSTTGLTMNPVDFVTAMIKAGAGSYFDALSFHPYQETTKFSDGYAYPGLGSPLEQLDAIKGLIGTAKSVWISEYGLPTSDVSQQQQSDYIKDLLDYWQGYSQAGPVFLYTTRDGAPGSSAYDNSYGLYNNDWTPKTAALMLQAWIKAHPQTPGTPTTPTPPTTPPVDPVAAYFAAVAAQYAAVIAAYVAAIQQWFGALTTPAATPLAVKVAAVQKTAVTSLAAPADPATADATATSASVSPASADPAVATAVDAAKAAATAATAAADVVKDAVPTSAVDPATATPATPDVVTTPAKTEPVVTKPVVAETPATTAPAVTKPADTTPAATTPAASGADKGTTDSPTKPTGTDESGSDKSGSDKSGSDKSGSDKPAVDKSGSDKSGATPRGKWKIRHAKGDKPSADASSADSSTPAVAK